MVTTTEAELLEELIRLQILQMRKNMESQADAISALHSVGFSPTRIASLLGTTSATVNVAISRTKKKTNVARERKVSNAAEKENQDGQELQ